MLMRTCPSGQPSAVQIQTSPASLSRKQQLCSADNYLRSTLRFISHGVTVAELLLLQQTTLEHLEPINVVAVIQIWLRMLSTIFRPLFVQNINNHLNLSMQKFRVRLVWCGFLRHVQGRNF
jgi:hypothetical protein